MCLVSACKTQAQLWEEIKMLFPGLTAWLEGPAYQVDLAKTNRCCQRCKVKKEEFFLGWNQCLKLSFQSFQRCCTIFEQKTMESLLLAAEACFCSWMAYIRYVSPTDPLHYLLQRSVPPAMQDLKKRLRDFQSPMSRVFLTPKPPRASFWVLQLWDKQDKALALQHT